VLSVECGESTDVLTASAIDILDTPSDQPCCREHDGACHGAPSQHPAPTGCLHATDFPTPRAARQPKLRRSAHPELIEQHAPLRTVLVIAETPGLDVDNDAVRERDPGRLIGDLRVDPQDISVITAPVGGVFRSELPAPNPNCGF
jgi:hypothetical protein